MEVIYTFEEFRNKMNCEFIRNVNVSSRTGLDVNRYLFVNGGRSDGTTHHLPPTDPQALKILRREFLEAKIEQWSNEYENFRNHVSAQAQYHSYGVGPSPDDRWPDWQEHLSKLAAEISDMQAEVREIDQALPQDPHWTEYVSHRNEQRQQAQTVTSRLNAMPSFPRQMAYRR